MEKSRYLYHQLDVVVQENLREKLQNTLNNNFIVIIRHAKTRANERKVNKSDLIKFLKKGEYRIVELNIKASIKQRLKQTGFTKKQVKEEN